MCDREAATMRYLKVSVLVFGSSSLASNGLSGLGSLHCVLGQYTSLSQGLSLHRCVSG